MRHSWEAARTLAAAPVRSSIAAAMVAAVVAAATAVRHTGALSGAWLCIAPDAACEPGIAW